MHALSKVGLATLGMALLGGCSTITQGTSQDLAINTNPSGATCELNRQGQKIGEIYSTPGTLNVKKTKHDITIVCNKTGYQTATYINNSGWESGSGAAGIALDVVLTLGVSSAIDSATGADNRYESPVNITLVPGTGDAPVIDNMQKKADETENEATGGTDAAN